MGQNFLGKIWGKKNQYRARVFFKTGKKSGKVNVIFDGNQFKKRGSVFLDKDSLVWHSTNHYLKLFPFKWGKKYQLSRIIPGDLTRTGTMTALKNGAILLTDLENRILELNSTERKTIFHKNLSLNLSTKRAVNSIFEDDNLLWLATNSGLFKVDFQSSYFQKILRYENGLNSIRSISELDNQELLVSAYTGLHFFEQAK